MITRLEITNYKSIKKLTLEFRPFMVLVGPNGAGKTNVVQALKLFGDLLGRGTTAPARELGWKQIVHREKKPARGGLRFSATFRMNRGFLQRSRDPEHETDAFFSVVLSGSTASHDIRVTSEDFRLGAGDSALRVRRGGDGLKIDPTLAHELWKDYATFYSLGSRKSEGSRLRLTVPEKYLESQRLEVLGRHSPVTVLARALAAQSATRRLRLDSSALRSDDRFDLAVRGIGPSGEGLPVAVDQLRGRGDKPAPAFLPILTALRQVYPRIEDVKPETFAQGRVTLLFKERGISDPIPLDGVSDGVLHALALLIALRSPGEGVLAIEEPENALHPWSVRKVLEQAQVKTDQRVLLTTHSEAVVNAVKDPDSLFIVEGDEVTGTTVVPATTKEKALRAILAESGQQLGDIWLDGTLGGVPT